MFWKKKKRMNVPQVMVTSCARYCQKEKCAAGMWVTLDTNYIDENGKKSVKSESRCAFGWIPQLLIEIKEAIINGKNQTTN